jgi:hypothetical protein
VYSASVSHGAGGNGGKTLTMSGGAVTVAYSSGAGSTSLVYTLSRTVNAGETGTTAYTQSGNGIEATTGGADVATYSGAAVTNNSTAGGAGIGFAARPYFFQADATRLADSITNNEPQATGSASNSIGQPLGFITMMNATLANRAANDDIDWWNLAVGGWLKGDNAMMDMAKDECLAWVRANPDGTPLGSMPDTSDTHQHIEGLMLLTAGVVDCCYSRFTSGERAEVATYVNGALAESLIQLNTNWPRFTDSHNNYFQNQILARAIAGLCGEGWNASAGAHRTQFEAWAAIAVTQYTAPTYTGPQITEGHYYSAYTAHLFWAFRQYDAVMGSNYMAQLSFTPNDMLGLALHQLRPHNGLFFSTGSEAANAAAPFHGVQWNLWHQCIFLSPNTTEAKVAKTILQSSAVSTEANNSWSRSSKAFGQFYWPFTGTTAGALALKTDRRLALPTPGGAMTHLRSTAGWAGTGRAALVFHHSVVWDGDNARYPGYSHANVDQPGFQWAQSNQWLVLDPEASGGGGISGVDGELGGSTVLSDISNIITLASAKYTGSLDYPVTTHNEDNTGAAIPHYYLNIDAQPYWTMCTIYRRQYVWLDDLQVLVMHDRVATSGANTKTFRLHMLGTTTVASGVATTTTPGGLTVKVRDLYMTSGGAMSAAAVTAYGSTYRITQTDAGNDIRSLKVLDVGNRVSAASLSSGAGYLQADMTINGSSVAVRFFDDGSHATVS